MVENVIDWINLYLVNGAISFPEFICWIVIVRWKALPAFEQLGPELTSKIFQVANNSRRLNLSLEIKSIVIGSILPLQRTVRELSLLGMHGVVLLLIQHHVLLYLSIIPFIMCLKSWWLVLLNHARSTQLKEKSCCVRLICQRQKQTSCMSKLPSLNKW